VILVSVIILLPLILVVGLIYVSWEITNALFCREKYNYDEDSFNIDFNNSKWGKFSYDYEKWIDKLMEEE
jgi:heme/copper-type cytochrome/quinol oxidase subunit 2